MGATTAASIQVAAERRQLKFADFATILAHPKCPEAAKQALNPLAIPAKGKHVVPDNLFAIQGERPCFYAVEIERRTESIASDTAKTAYGRKLAGYIDILSNRPYRVRVPVEADHGFRWKLITESGGK